ncbi:MAG TPA: PhzF family phenazine biosynthesis protein [Gammaproteobacteria bacterium]|nr:PhzF family phenazine biosynthesis protein [Gammaproteobacteria bacterium]
MQLDMYQIDAFTDYVFGGNPAAVVPLAAWLDAELMQAIAAENNLSETAFFVPAGDRYELRWFTPTTEVELCGHATLASAHLIFTRLDTARREVRFVTKSGELGVARDGDRLVLDFPRWELRALERAPPELNGALGLPPEQVFSAGARGTLFALFGGETEVRALEPDMAALARLHPATVVATARGTESDCVCRYFAPSYGVPEDPGTGSIHCGLVPFWSEQLGKRRIHSLQVSKRGAEFWCELRGDRTLIAGQAVTYLSGTIDV